MGTTQSAAAAAPSTAAAPAAPASAEPFSTRVLAACTAALVPTGLLPIHPLVAIVAAYADRRPLRVSTFAGPFGSHTAGFESPTGDAREWFFYRPTSIVNWNWNSSGSNGGRAGDKPSLLVSDVIRLLVCDSDGRSAPQRLEFGTAGKVEELFGPEIAILPVCPPRGEFLRACGCVISLMYRA